ncbi:aminoimidazole riboside kinase [Klebsiella michiganensis]|uniref:aminoimidazole riboside kinase n=1 Tax=Klebsiella michiganensis TaxID=1134687 RepID=UPI000A1CABC0|nr:aminoimidazole riboside kinase [Klebsiella michiganensis]AVE78616.1 aminoimidazole riboside kinase [Klebsiella oxytoca]MBZ7330399.1 aminoimidazole riboside kinase [Klebsiella michiganensis]MDM4567417.1 aminoimidazole riboside kinase [Klebsiella michiganensis]MDM4584246.1 aminoimidazole riboside kinase [Klebsiella michiganensis]
MNAKVWVLGDAVVDLLPESEGRLLRCPGGAPANVAVGIARLGGDSGFIGRVGDDPFGRFMRHTLQQEQVDVSHMRLDGQHRTSTVVVDLDDQGERTFTFMVRPSADLFLAEEDLPQFTANQWLHVCSIALSAEPSRSTTFSAMESIKHAGGRVSFDPNIRPDLWQDQELLHACLDRALRMANVVKLSEEELVFISGSDDLAYGIASVTERYQPELLLVTKGKAGVLAAFQQQFTHFSAKPVVSVDTTGAGDAFVAGLLASLAANGMPTDIAALEPTLTLAQTCGALATTAKGAMTALPYQRDLNRQF